MNTQVKVLIPTNTIWFFFCYSLSGEEWWGSNHTCPPCPSSQGSRGQTVGEVASWLTLVLGAGTLIGCMWKWRRNLVRWVKGGPETGSEEEREKKLRRRERKIAEKEKEMKKREKKCERRERRCRRRMRCREEKEMYFYDI